MKHLKIKLFVILSFVLLGTVLVSPSAFAHINSTGHGSQFAKSGAVKPHDIFVCDVSSQSSKNGRFLLGRGTLECITPTFYSIAEVWVKAQYCVPILWGCFYESPGTTIAHRLLDSSQFRYNVLYKVPEVGTYGSIATTQTGEWRIQVQACVADEDESSQPSCQNVNSAKQIF